MKKNIALIVLTLTTVVSLTGWVISTHQAHNHEKIISKTIGHKQKNLSLKNDDTIKTQNFEVEYHDQGDGADGIKLLNVKK